MKLVVGLGNPGSRYVATRHNIGWRVVDALVAESKKDFRPAKGEYYVFEGRFGGVDAAIIKPTTFMNGSGIAVAEAIKAYDVDIATELLIVLDEFQLPLGTIRITTTGGDGGHNGLASVISTLLTDRFARLRCGIDRNFGPGEMVDYVLAPFTKEQEPVVDDMTSKARDAARTMIVDGLVKAMNVYN